MIVATSLPPCPCPFCGYEMDAASGKREPNPGDISICISCAQPLVFTQTMQLRAMTPAEWGALDLPNKTELRRYMAAVRALDRRGPRKAWRCRDCNRQFEFPAAAEPNFCPHCRSMRLRAVAAR